MVTIEYRCQDGSPFPVTFATEADAALTWSLDREHVPRPLTPLAEALARMGDAGAVRAYEEVGMVRPAGFRPGPSANGFAYFCQEFATPDELAVLATAGKALVHRYGSALGIWRDYCLPLVEQDCAALDAAGPDAPLAHLAEVMAHCGHVTMIPAFVGGYDIQQLADALTDLHGEDARRVAYELTQGFDNPTVRADQALWRLGRLVRESDALAAAMSSPAPPAALAELRAAGHEPAFFAALDRFFEEFGHQAEGWDIADPVWSEDGGGLWPQLRQMARTDAVDPADALAKAAARRQQLIAEVELAWQGDREKLARFRARLERVLPYVTVREERAQWQLVSCGALRQAVLRRGAAMVSAGLVDEPTDVLYLLPEELEGPDAAAADARARVAARRAEHGTWLRMTPPPVVGGTSADPAPAGSRPDDLLRGTGASRGVATGPARVITELADADRLQPGDVLVCVTTAPPWTPLFGLASAVVADSGDIASHVAIAAREYGIPCVLATGRATSAIPDGAIVTVDGTAGTVQAEKPVQQFKP